MEVVFPLLTFLIPSVSAAAATAAKVSTAHWSIVVALIVATVLILIISCFQKDTHPLVCHSFLFFFFCYACATKHSSLQSILSRKYKTLTEAVVVGRTIVAVSVRIASLIVIV